METKPVEEQQSNWCRFLVSICFHCNCFCSRRIEGHPLRQKELQQRTYLVLLQDHVISGLNVGSVDELELTSSSKTVLISSSI